MPKSTGPNAISVEVEKLRSGLMSPFLSHHTGKGVSLSSSYLTKCLRDCSFMAPKLYFLWLHFGLTHLPQASPPMPGGGGEREADNPRHTAMNKNL